MFACVFLAYFCVYMCVCVHVHVLDCIFGNSENVQTVGNVGAIVNSSCRGRFHLLSKTMQISVLLIPIKVPVTVVANTCMLNHQCATMPFNKDHSLIISTGKSYPCVTRQCCDQQLASGIRTHQCTGC